MTKTETKVEQPKQKQYMYVKKAYKINYNLRTEFDLTTGEVVKAGNPYVVLSTPTNPRGCVIPIDSLVDLMKDLGQIIKDFGC